MRKISFTKNSYLIAYKLLHDALMLALVTFSLMLIGEGLIPGFVSARLSFSKMVIAIILILSAIVWIGKVLGITYDAPKIKGNKILPILVLAAFLLIGNSMLHFQLWANIIITLTILFIFFLIYELIFTE